MVVNSIRLAICEVVQFQHKVYASAYISWAFQGVCVCMCVRVCVCVRACVCVEGGGGLNA